MVPQLQITKKFRRRFHRLILECLEASEMFSKCTSRCFCSDVQVRWSIIQHVCLLLTLLVAISLLTEAGYALQAPTSYPAAYSGVDAKTIPTAPALGGVNYIFTDPTFGSHIVRITDERSWPD